MTDSMKAAIGETERRRTKQIAHNLAQGITPKSVTKRIRDMIDGAVSDKSAKDDLKAAQGKRPKSRRCPRRTSASASSCSKSRCWNTRATSNSRRPARVRDQLALLREQAFGGSRARCGRAA